MKFKAELVIHPTGTWEIIVKADDKESKDLVLRILPEEVEINKLGETFRIGVKEIKFK